MNILEKSVDNKIQTTYIIEKKERNCNLMRAKQMEQIINYRDIPTDKKLIF